MLKKSLVAFTILGIGSLALQTPVWAGATVEASEPTHGGDSFEVPQSPKKAHTKKQKCQSGFVRVLRFNHGAFSFDCQKS